MSIVSYAPSGTQLAFHNDRHLIRLICGSPGGGKTVACLMEIVFLMMRQPPGHDGIRRHRTVVVRKTYARLRTTVLKTIEAWYPAECGAMKQTAPMEGRYVIPLPDGTTGHLEVLALALEDAKALQSLRSLEASSFYLNEVNELDRDVINIAVERCGRYPSAKDGAPCAEPAILCDFNTVSREHWLYDFCVANPPADARLFMQEPAVICHNFEEWWAAPGDSSRGGQFEVNPDAPNLENLPPGYYTNMLSTYSKRQIASLLMLRWVTGSTGKLIFPDFLRRDHVTGLRTEPHQNEAVLIGIDTSGLHPAAVFGQVQGGTLVVMDEVFGDGVAFEEFLTSMLLPVIAARYQGLEIVASTDPSNPRDARTGVTPNQLLMQYRIMARSASTNKFELRRQAVSKLLNRRNGLLIDVVCSRVIVAFEEGYTFRRLPGGSSTSGALYAESPVKNEHSHIMDALQYLCLPVARTAEEPGFTASTVQVRRRRVM